MSKNIEVTEAYVMGDGQVVTAKDLITLPTKPTKNELRQEYQKAHPGSQQQDSQDTDREINEKDIIQPIYNPEILAKILEYEAVHFRCAKTKCTDAVLRDYTLERPKDDDEDISEESFQADKRTIKHFLKHCGPVFGFEGTLEKGALDYETVGWAAFEVVRSRDKRVAHLYHIPAERIRVLKGWRGFAEMRGGKVSHYYLPFGAKVKSPKRENLDGTPADYDPFEDGDIEDAKWNFRDPNDLMKVVSDSNKSANEVIFLPKPHPRSVYYGIPDIIPAIGSVLANVNIKDFFLQFFEHNTVPQYAIIIKGASLSPEVKRAIEKYFSSEVKGQNHKTLLIPIPGSGTDVDVEFKKLGTEDQEASFQETRQNNWTEITIAHGMSPAVIGNVETANLGSGKGSAQQENYKNRVVSPLQKIWSRKINEIFAKGLGITTVELHFDSLDAADLKEERENLLAYVDSGCLTINAVRRRAKLGPPVSYGDIPFIKVGASIIPLSMLSDSSGATDEKVVESLKELRDELQNQISAIKN